MPTVDELFYNDVINQAKSVELDEALKVLNRFAWKIENMLIISNLTASEATAETVWTGVIKFKDIPYEIGFEENLIQTIFKEFAVLADMAEVGE